MNFSEVSPFISSSKLFSKAAAEQSVIGDKRRLPGRGGDGDSGVDFPRRNRGVVGSSGCGGCTPVAARAEGLAVSFGVGLSGIRGAYGCDVFEIDGGASVE